MRDLKRLSKEASARSREALQDAPQAEATTAALAALDELGKRLARFELVSAAPQCRPLEGDGAPVEPIVEPAAVLESASR